MANTLNLEKNIHNSEFELATEQDIERFQERGVLSLIRHVYNTNSFYRAKWQSAGVDIGAIKSLEDARSGLPLVEKSDFLKDQLAHPPYGSRIEGARHARSPLDFYTTSGTSGQGTEIHAQTASELKSMVDSYVYGMTWSGLKPADVVGLTIPVTMFAGGRCEMQGATGADLTVLPLGNYDAERKLEIIQQFNVRGLIASTSYCTHLAALHPDPSSLGVEILLTGLEGATLPYLQRIEEQWGARVFDRFGCAAMRADFMFSCEYGIGTEQRPGLLHNISPNVWFEVIDPDTGQHVADGEYGEIVVTSLYNTEIPLVRCRLRDGGIYRKGSYCPCGRPFSGIEIASISRMDDVKKIKGVNIYPQALEATVFSFPEVDEYEVRIVSSPDATDVATVTVMIKDDVNRNGYDEIKERLAGSLREKLGIRFVVQIGDIPRSEYKARRWHDDRDR